MPEKQEAYGWASGLVNAASCTGSRSRSVLDESKLKATQLIDYRIREEVDKVCRCHARAWCLSRGRGKVATDHVCSV